VLVQVNLSLVANSSSWYHRLWDSTHHCDKAIFTLLQKEAKEYRQAAQNTRIIYGNGTLAAAATVKKETEYYAKRTTVTSVAQSAPYLYKSELCLPNDFDQS
jgi:hypothetical protein